MDKDIVGLFSIHVHFYALAHIKLASLNRWEKESISYVTCFLNS